MACAASRKPGGSTSRSGCRACAWTQWLFPTVADVGPADADVNPASADIAWSNGVWVANGNLAIRHPPACPTVTVPMGVMADIGMPVGLTFAGRAYDDSALLRFAAAFESTGARRIVPPRTPPLVRE
ncbi:amidase [Pseudomonas aeruginosa]|nr:amidase [Pseudomonas aeruginosa]